ncbi:MAG: transposase [Paenibacillus sp.]|jgi:hypothetical protein|nr:transposase [Paenibacillus sp.]
MQIENFYEDGYLPFLSGIMNDLGLRRKIDELVPVDRQCQTTAGEAVQLLVLDMLSGRNALMNVDKWAAEQDMDQLLRPGLQASWFNDDVLGRHLDRQYEVEIHQVYSTFQLQVHQHERIPMGVFHGDYDEHVRLRRIHETEQSADILGKKENHNARVSRIAVRLILDSVK